MLFPTVFIFGHWKEITEVENKSVCLKIYFSWMRGLLIIGIDIENACFGGLVDKSSETKIFNTNHRLCLYSMSLKFCL